MNTKIIMSLFATLLLFGLVACSAPQETQNEAKAEAQDAIEEVQKELDMEETIPKNADVEEMVDAIEEMAEEVEEPIVHTSDEVADFADEKGINDEKLYEAPEGDMPMSEWCIPGETYNFEQDGNTVHAILKGPTTYKGSEFCQGYEEVTIQGMDIVTDYYLTYGAEEMWVVAKVAGTTTEMHIKDGKIVE